MKIFTRYTTLKQHTFVTIPHYSSKYYQHTKHTLGIHVHVVHMAKQLGLLFTTVWPGQALHSYHDPDYYGLHVNHILQTNKQFNLLAENVFQAVLQLFCTVSCNSPYS